MTDSVAIIDLRDEEAYRVSRPVGAVRLSHFEVRECAYLLPPRHKRLLLVGGSADHAAPLLETLRRANRQVEHLPGESWRRQLPEESGPPSRTHLWQPATTVVRAARYLDASTQPRVLDLACGSGRNAVYLALQGFDVTAIDWDAGALTRAEDLASRHNVKIRTLREDLEQPGALDAWRASIDLIVVVRFLDRALFAQISESLAPGGIVAYETFTLAQASRGHPRQERFLLQPGELRQAFAGLECLEYEEDEFDEAHLARLIARRPSS